MLCVCCCCCYTLDSFYSFIRFPSTTSSPEYKIDTCFTHILCFGFSFLYHRLEREKEMKFSCFSPIQCDTHFTSLSTVAAHLCVFLLRSARFFYVSRSTVLIFRIVLVHPFFFILFSFTKSFQYEKFNLEQRVSLSAYVYDAPLFFFCIFNVLITYLMRFNSI